MSRSHIARKLISVLFFGVALVLLLAGEFGILTYPGIFAAGLGIVLCFVGRFLLAAGIGIISATISFLGQAMVGFCPYCAGAASAFAMAGIFAIIPVITQNKKWGLIIAPLLASIK